MQIKTKTTYDAGKLAKMMPRIIKGLLKRYAIESIDDIKGNIDGRLKPPLGKTTLDIRKKRGVEGTKPLYATGKLYNSIKLKKGKNVAGISMWKYGALHHKGFNTDSKSMIPRKHVPKRPWIEPKKGTIKKLVKDFGKDISKHFNKSTGIGRGQL